MRNSVPGPLRELFDLAIQRVDDLAHVVQGVQCGLVRLILGRLVEHDEYAVALVEYAVELVVQDHLRELSLHMVLGTNTQSMYSLAVTIINLLLLWCAEIFHIFKFQNVVR